jgi:hypothetical protein
VFEAAKREARERSASTAAAAASDGRGGAYSSRVDAMRTVWREDAAAAPSAFGWWGGGGGGGGSFGPNTSFAELFDRELAALRREPSRGDVRDRRPRAVRAAVTPFAVKTPPQPSSVVTTRVCPSWFRSSAELRWKALLALEAIRS